MESRTRVVNNLKELGEKYLCVAFSGGVDSSVILRAACEAAAANGKSVYAVTYETKLHPKADLPQAQRVAKEAGAIHHVINVNELDNEEMLNNPENRCYLCKKYLFQNLLAFAAEKGIDVLYCFGLCCDYMADAAKKAGMKEVYYLETQEEFWEKGLPTLKDGDTILLKASRSREFETTEAT